MRREYYRWIPGILVGMVLVGLLLSRHSSTEIQWQSHARQPVAPSPTARPAALKRTAAPAKTKKQCQRHWATLERVDLGRLFYDNDASVIPSLAEGCEGLPSAMRELLQHSAYYCSMLRGLEPRGARWEGARNGCAFTLAVYRAQLTEWLTGDVPLESIRDPKIVAEKAIARFTEDPRAAAEAAERLMELDPSSYPAAKTALISRLVDEHRSAEGGKIDDATAERLQAKLDRARELGIADAAHLSELDFAIEALRRRDPDALRARAREVLEHSPQSGLGHYLMSCAESRAGNEAAALAALRRAAATDPDTARYRELLEAKTNTAPGRVTQVCGANMELPTELLIPRH